MKELQGKCIVVGVGSEKLKGTVIADFHDRLVLASNGENGGKTTSICIMKDKLSYFSVQEDKTVEELEKIGSAAAGVPLTIIGCDNKKIGCPGVKLFVNKFEQDVTNEHFDAIMKPCPMCQKTCRKGSHGNIFKADPRVLIALLNGTVIGEYPKQKNQA